LKILFTQDALINAGTERSNLELISRFSEDLDVSLVYFYPRHDLKEDYELAGIRLFFLDIPESYNLYLGIKRLIKLIKQEKPDLLVSSLWRGDIITRISSIFTGVPLVGTFVNDSYSPISWKDKSGLKHKVVYWIDRLTAGIPIHWIANSQALVESHQKTLGINPNKVSVVYRGREVPVIARTRYEDEAIFSKKTPSYKETASPPRRIAVTRHFISYGRLLERKGFQDAIQAFSEVIKIYPDCTLTIYGEGTYRPQLEALISKLCLQEKVKLPGKVSDPTVLLNTEHCFLFPSWYEGFSGALVEAMMAGIPIIASDIPMNLEAVEADKSALIFPIGDSRSLKEKMMYAIENPEMMIELGKAAKFTAIQRFDIDVIAKQYQHTLVSIYNQNRSKKNK